MVIQRQLGHSNLGIASVYLQGIDNAEIIEAVHARRAPMIPVERIAATLMDRQIGRPAPSRIAIARRPTR